MARQEVGGPGWLALGLKERGQHLGLRKPLGPQVSESLAEPFPLFYSLVIGASLLPGLFVESTRKGSVVSRANSIGSTSASSVPTTGRRQHPPTRGTRCAFILVFFLDRTAPAFHMGALEP